MLIRTALAALLVAAAPAPGMSKVDPAKLAKPQPRTLFEVPATRIDGKAGTLEAYRGQVVLVVNTASKCGYTSQYTGLQALHTKYAKQGLAVLGFPSNDFFGQEPGTNAEIAAFCGREFDVSFPMFAKVAVSGDDVAPVYRFLLDDAARRGKSGAIGWNFEKFLVGRDGHVIDRWKSRVEPQDPAITQAIQQALLDKPGKQN